MKLYRKRYTDFWKEIAQVDPYFGVLSHEKYLSSNLDNPTKQAFFETGERHVENVFKIFQQVWPDERHAPQNALDFGCGTGRITLALSQKCTEVTGIDVSPAMIAEAEKNQLAQEKKNIQFIVSPGEAPFLTETYDYIHSAMVFQHIHPKDGFVILDHLVDHLSPSGLAFIQLNYHTIETPMRRLFRKLNFTFPSIGKVFSPNSTYRFPMFDYDLGQVYSLLQNHRIKRIFSIAGESGPHQFVRLYLQKKPLPHKPEGSPKPS